MPEAAVASAVGAGALEQRGSGAGRVQAPLDDLVEEPLELGIALELLLQPAPHPRAGQREDLVAQLRRRRSASRPSARIWARCS